MEQAVREYYESEQALTDFFTAPHLDAAFGRAVGEFLVPYLQEFEKPAILELGAGTGIFARDLLSYLREGFPELFSRLTYHIYEFSERLIERQRALLSEFGNVSWTREVPHLEGIVLSNEFFDSLPVHVVREGKELFVEGDRLLWLELENPRIREFLSKMGYEDLRQVVEVPLDGLDFLKNLAGRIRGYNLVIDYGYTSEEIERYPEGTVVGYRQHRTVQSLEEIVKMKGKVDVTAHVNFSALIEYGRDFGFEPVLFQTQRDFLLHVPGFLNELERLSWEESPEGIERLSRLKTMLISMGERFRVLLQRKSSQ